MISIYSQDNAGIYVEFDRYLPGLPECNRSHLQDGLQMTPKVPASRLAIMKMLNQHRTKSFRA